MSAKTLVFPITITPPATASTVIADSTTWANSLEDYEYFTIDISVTGGTGGTLDVYLQRRVGSNLWADWLHLPQAAAGAAISRYTVTPLMGASAITVVGTGTDSAATPALAANTFVGGHPGDAVRCVVVAGSGTTVGGTVTGTLKFWRPVR